MATQMAQPVGPERVASMMLDVDMVSKVHGALAASQIKVSSANTRAAKCKYLALSFHISNRHSPLLSNVRKVFEAVIARGERG